MIRYHYQAQVLERARVVKAQPLQSKAEVARVPRWRPVMTPTITAAAGRLLIDVPSQLVQIDKQTHHVTPHQARMLACLARGFNTVVDYERLASEVWDDKWPEDIASALKQRVYLVRRLLQRTPLFITSEWDLGYRLGLVSPDDPRTAALRERV